MIACLAILAILFLDLVRDGASRFGWDFFTSFPSRKAERAGILSAAVGTTMIMFVTALVALPVGVAAAIYLEEYAPKNWFTGIIEINVTNLAGVPVDRLRAARARALRLPVRLRRRACCRRGSRLRC